MDTPPHPINNSTDVKDKEAQGKVPQAKALTDTLLGQVSLRYPQAQNVETAQLKRRYNIGTDCHRTSSWITSAAHAWLHLPGSRNIAWVCRELQGRSTTQVFLFSLFSARVIRAICPCTAGSFPYPSQTACDYSRVARLSSEVKDSKKIVACLDRSKQLQVQKLYTHHGRKKQEASIYYNLPPQLCVSGAVSPCGRSPWGKCLSATNKNTNQSLRLQRPLSTAETCTIVSE